MADIGITYGLLFLRYEYQEAPLHQQTLNVTPRQLVWPVRTWKNLLRNKQKNNTMEIMPKGNNALNVSVGFTLDFLGQCLFFP